MKSLLFYPAIFTEELEGGYTIVFPDLDGCLTYGKDIEESYKMAVEVLGMTLVYLDEEKKGIPEPSKPQNIKLENGQFVVVVEFNLYDYRKRYDSKAVSKNCTIPNWMNTLATEQGINFSQVLQDALKEKLSV